MRQNQLDRLDQSELQHVDLIPIEDFEEENLSSKNKIGVNYKRLSNIIPILTEVQKYSSYTFTIFTFIHGTTVLVAPALSTSIAGELLSMGRSLYQGAGLEGVLVWGSLTTHILAGVSIRLLRNVMYRIRYGTTKRRDELLRKKRKQSAVDPNAIKQNIDGELQVLNDKEIGLSGGVSNLVGLGAKKSFVYRTFGLSPLQMSGYLSIPLVAYHALQTRFAPLVVEGDSSYVSLEYITYIFNGTLSLWKPVLNWVIYPSMILLTTYHTIYGILKWNKVKNLKIRKLAVNAISLISLLGIWSLYLVTKLDLEFSVQDFVLKRFDKYLEFFYYLRT